MSALPKRNDYEELRPRPKKLIKAQRNPIISYLVGVVIMGGVLAFMYIMQYATVVQADSSIRGIKKKIEEMRKENDVLKREITNFKSYHNIRETAKIKLGMVYPTEKDIVVLNE